MILDGFFVRCAHCGKLHAAEINLHCSACGEYVPTWECHQDVPSPDYPYQRLGRRANEVK